MMCVHITLGTLHLVCVYHSNALRHTHTNWHYNEHAPALERACPSIMFIVTLTQFKRDARELARRSVRGRGTRRRFHMHCIIT